MTIEDQADFFTECQRTLCAARDAGPTKQGNLLLRLGAAMVDTPAFATLPEAAQEDLLSLYARTMMWVSGGLS